MNDEERFGRLGSLGMECIDLEQVYRWLGSSLGAFGTRLHATRPDACDAFFANWRKQRHRANLIASEIELGIRAANVGVGNDGPDKWTSWLDALNRKNNGG